MVDDNLDLGISCAMAYQILQQFHGVQHMSEVVQNKDNHGVLKVI